MLFVSDYDEIQGAPRTIIITISIIAIAASIILAILLFLKAKDSKVRSSKRYSIGAAIFLLGVGIGRLIFLYHDYFAVDELDYSLWIAANLVTILGLEAFVYIIEKFVYPKTKFALTIFGAIMIVAFAIMNYGFSLQVISRVILNILTFAFALLPLAIYLYMWKVGTGNIQKQALYISSGLIILLLSSGVPSFLYDFQMIERAPSQIIAFSLVLIAYILLGKGFLIKQD